MRMTQTKMDVLTLVTDHLVGKLGSHRRGDIEVFLSQLYQHSPEIDLRKFSLEEIVEGLALLWDKLQKRQSGEVNINIYFWRAQQSSALSDRLIIDVVNDDMPFLVDSLLGCLSQEGMRSRVVMHPVFVVQRDQEGNLISLQAPNGVAKEGRFESVIHCEVVEGASPEMVDILQQRLKELFQDVRLATRDWQKMREKITSATDELRQNISYVKDSTAEDVLVFLDWIKNEHFTFLGYCNYDLITAEGKLLREPSTREGLGILEPQETRSLGVLYEGITFNSLARRYIHEPVALSINKTTRISNVHRPVPMDSLWVKRFNEHGQVVGIHLFVGLFTSVAYDSSARDIPLLKKKIYQIIDYSSLSSHWHDGKSLIHILDSLPRDELFQASVPELSKIGLAVLRLQQSPRVALFVRQDQFNRFLSCLVYVPRDRFDSALCDQIGEILSQEFKGEVSAYKAQFGALDFARIHYTVSLSEGAFDSFDIDAIETKLIAAARSWKDELRQSLNEKFQEIDSVRLYKRYRDAFSRGYQERFRGPTAVEDMVMIDQLLSQDKTQVRLGQEDGGTDHTLKLKIYHDKIPVALSDILPILENLDLKVISEIPFKVKIAGIEHPVWIHHFDTESRTGRAINFRNIEAQLLEIFENIWAERIENDGFNRLILRAGLNWRQCVVMRAYCKYLRQLQMPFSKESIESALANNSASTALIMEFFEKKFNPQVKQVDEELRGRIMQSFESIKSPDEDRILRAYLNLMDATIRTNFYQRLDNDELKSCISFKFACAKIEDMPLPRPLYEIFVYSPRFEAVHLRGGKVARGGIRWSDRLEDFRTEILGLVKAQMVKNTVIIPVGSKGGFVLKRDLKGVSRDVFFNEGIECYQMMMRGLLDITDNIMAGTVHRPENVACWDDEDPYLVVAADKGTASFSDYANGVSAEYKFWLGDAFASGGSAGYDHKKMAITARGAWESVKRHFREIGVDVNTSPISVIGVGDMSGDVFGNGMLQSQTLRLLFAFNHQHIFIDPNPDLLKSYQERERMFKLPRSTWKDYAKEALSEGGGVFERSAKEIMLSSQAQALLGLSSNKTTPNRLIQAILTFHADLLWLGGIGTFIKSSKESHADAGDRANDGVRVNGRDLQCKIVGEGANLGFTQLGRIEYAAAGGRINTDAIDNSAGVDCSDHEVNIKILLNQVMQEKAICLDDRNILLGEMTEEVSDLVLRDNYLQTQALSIIQAKGARNLDYQIKLIHTLEKQGKLNRNLEFLPDDMQLQDLQVSQKSLTRPEMSILLAYSKIVLYEDILASSLPDDPYFETALFHYFPQALQLRFPEFIKKHPLRREIIATYITNYLVNRLGITFMLEAREKSGRSLEEIVRSAFTIINVFDLESFWQDIENLDSSLKSQAQIHALNDVMKISKRTTLWLLRYHSVSSIDVATGALRQGIGSFLASLAGSLDEEGYAMLAGYVALYVQEGLEEDLAQRLAILKMAATSPDIVLIASEANRSVEEVAGLYFLVSYRFGFNHLRQCADSLASSSFWQRWASSGLQEDLYSYQTHMVIQILQFQSTSTSPQSAQELLNQWINAHQKEVNHFEQILAEAKNYGLNDLALITVVARELRQLCFG